MSLSVFLRTCKRRPLSMWHLLSERPQDLHTSSTSQSVDGLITAQVKLEVKIKMDILQNKTGTRDSLGPEIRTHLSPYTTASRERIAKIACEKMEGATSGDLAAKVTEAVESTIVEQFQKGIDKQLRDLMKWEAVRRGTTQQGRISRDISRSEQFIFVVRTTSSRRNTEKNVSITRNNNPQSIVQNCNSLHSALVCASKPSTFCVSHLV